MINELNYNLIIIKKEFNKSNYKISKIINVTRVDERNHLIEITWQETFTNDYQELKLKIMRMIKKNHPKNLKIIRLKLEKKKKKFITWKWSIKFKIIK